MCSVFIWCFLCRCWRLHRGPAALGLWLGGSQPLSPHDSNADVLTVQPGPLHLQLSRDQPRTKPLTRLLRGRAIAGVPAVGSAGAEPSSQSSHAAGSQLCSRELWVVKPAQGAVWSQADSGEKRWCCVHLLQVPAPVKRVQRSYKSSVKSKSKSCLKGRVNSCGGTAGRAPSGEGEGDQRVSSWSFIWIHLAPSLAGVTNVVNNCLPHLLPSGLFCSGF